MIEDMLNLQNKKAMKTNIKVELLYSFIHAQCVLELFLSKNKPLETVSLALEQSWWLWL